MPLSAEQQTQAEVTGTYAVGYSASKPFGTGITESRPTCWQCSWAWLSANPVTFGLKIAHADCPDHGHLATGA